MYENLEQLVMQQRSRDSERLRCFEKMQVRLDQKDDIEMFTLIQAVGLVEALQQEVVTTCHSKQSVFSFRLVQALQDLDVDVRILKLLLKGSEMQSDHGRLTPEVIQTSDEIRKEALMLLKEVIERRMTCR